MQKPPEVKELMLRRRYTRRRLTMPTWRSSSKNCNAQSGVGATLCRSQREGTPEPKFGDSGTPLESSSDHQAPTNRSTDSCLRKAKPEMPPVSQQNRANQNSPTFFHP